ncbi:MULTISPECIES: response regulator [Clostridium]|uniref:Stage 0 sporulation protein A homolog n=2 Tax=Clostridium TaxID=1485 RepID=A0A7X5SXN5_CLOSG|nr:response regulator [Clostridium sporogenes]AJD31740.1 response regulator [Clostridium botulinum Prevot_594]AVP62208.1 two-component system response regulator [Clostridium botulinum]AKC61267.1 response regulator [Clostridium sporogenes]AKJ88608.1 chemotaxis protein CheY [Clostridium sporogenes]KCZ68568.1 response regulator [Clostridium sporogenes]
MVKYGDINALNLFVGELNNVSIFILDKDFHYIKLNNSHKKFMKKLLGIDVEVGMNILEIIEEYCTLNISDNLIVRIKEKMKIALKGTKIITNEEVLIDGSKVEFYEIEIIPLKNEDNNILGVGACCLNITENVNTMIKVLKTKLDLTYKKHLKNSELPNRKNSNKKIFKILIAEDNNVNQIVMSKLIELNGWIAKTVSNGKDSIVALEKDSYDLIFMDISMPIMNGLDAANIIKKNPEWSKIPIVALTAYDSLEQKKKFKSLGMDDYLSKPIDSDKLLYIIDKHLNDNRQIKNNKMNLKKKEIYSSFERLEKNLDGNKELVIELAHKIIELFSKEQMDEIIRLSRDGDIENLRNLIHKLKGASSNFDLYEVKKLLNEIKERAILGDIENIYKLVEKITINMNILEKDLMYYRKNK